MSVYLVQTTLYRAGPLADLIQDVGCFEVAIFLSIGAGFKPVSLSVLVKRSSTRKSKGLKFLMEEL